jgi:hypothetical protein
VKRLEPFLRVDVSLGHTGAELGRVEGGRVEAQVLLPSSTCYLMTTDLPLPLERY